MVGNSKFLERNEKHVEQLPQITYDEFLICAGKALAGEKGVSTLNYMPKWKL